MHAAIKPSRKERRILEADNRQWPTALKRWPESAWPPLTMTRKPPVECWRSREFLVMVFDEADGVERLSIQRTHIRGPRFVDGIAWDDLQRLKSECGRGDRDAIEIYPADNDVVNVANMRHLWVLPDAHPLTWRRAVSEPTTKREGE